MFKKVLLSLSLISFLFAADFTKAAEVIEIDGSSTVYPITEAVAEEFQKKTGTRATVGISGTGGGFKKFCRGETAISDASRPIKESEVELCRENGIKYIELPVAFDGLSVMVNPENTWVKSMTVAELKKIWEPAAQEKIKKWNQVNSNWPDKPLKLYGAGTDSGTYDYFTEAIVGEEGASRGDFVGSEDDNVLVQGIARDENALGFFGYAYYEANKDKLKLVPIVNPQIGKPVEPSPETVQNGSYQPLSRPLFIYVSKKSVEEKPEVRKFVEFYLKNAPELVEDVGYIPLPDTAYELAFEVFKERKTGSVFLGKGSKAGVSIEDLIKSERAELKK